MIKGGIFDFDGTLFDSMYVWKDVAATYLISRGCTPKPGLREIVRRITLDQSSRYCKEEYGLTESAEEIKDGFNNIVAGRYTNEVLPKANVIAFLESLQSLNVKMCIATATDSHHIEAALSRCGMRQYFSDIITCSDVGCGKDKPDIFRAALERLGTSRSDTIVFEDAYHAICTAKADGFAVAGVYDDDEENPSRIIEASDVYIHNYADLTNFWDYALHM